MSAASEITRKAQSNLAFALKILPKDRRDDTVVFYAFCRTVDDIADEPGLTQAERHAALSEWEQGIVSGFPTPTEFQRELVSLRDRRSIPNDLLLAIIDGCRMDITPRRFENWDELSAYIWKVSCAVGLVCIRLFGCSDPQSERYATALGNALQMTNILRDVGEDFRNGGRIYLPMEDLEGFRYSPEDLGAGVRDERFLALMDYQATRAEGYFHQAREILPPSDRRALLPARIMSEIYHPLLVKMKRDRFQVFEKRYRLSSFRKLAILSKHLVARATLFE